MASQIYLPAEKPIETNQKDLSATLPNIAETRSVIREIAGDDCVAFLGFTPIVDILDSPIPLAALTPQEHILITSGMLEIVNTRSEFAFLMAHEIAHYLLGHLRTSEASVNSHWSLSQEASADALALKLLGNTTFHHSAAISLLQRLEAFGEESGTALRDLYPTLSQRRTTLLSAVSNIS
ncbi:MAG: M48 family metalloprotease [Bdellovibrionales bacterium]|nr:M48 family metalloprotease [Bdellovibrionales bacterium]